MATPFEVVRLESAVSTQDVARSDFAGDPMLVVAGTQTRGRGRSGSSWLSADRCVAASLAFIPGWEPSRLPRIPLVAGLAARDAIGDRVALKWPNDVVIGEEKVAGILAEGFDELTVAGLGVNLWWSQQPPAGFGAVFDEDPGPAAAMPMAVLWAERLLSRTARGPQAWGRDEYAAACSTIGRRVTWEPGGSGVATGIDESGRLVVETTDGAVQLDSGAVHTVRSRPGGTLAP